MLIQKNIRDLLIATVTVLGITYVYRAFKKRNGPLVRILVFHDVQNAEWFRESLICLTQKYNIISPEDFINNRFDSKQINVLITFDDGYTSWIEVCAPILREQNIYALFFINSGLVDAYDDVEKQKLYVKEQLMLSSRKTLSWEGVRALMRAGHTIGGHTVSHARLSNLSKNEQDAEIRGDKKCIEEMTQKQINTFAYPFGQCGDYTGDTVKIIKEEGYSLAFTTHGMFAGPDTSYETSRLCVEDLQAKKSLGQWIEGGYDVYVCLKSIFFL